MSKSNKDNREVHRTIALSMRSVKTNFKKLKKSLFKTGKINYIFRFNKEPKVTY
jgi:hypothetical protein